MKTANDKTVLKEFSRGSESAFRELFSMYYSKVLTFVGAIVKDDDVARNITQEAFIKVWERREAFSPEDGSITSFSGYLYVIARNAALNHLRRGRETLRLEDIYADSVSQEQEYLAREQELIIRLVVCRMPEKRRRVFEMSRFESIDNETIAATLGISKKTVENHISSALKEIREILLGV